MSIVVEKPGLQTTIQSHPRSGMRHLGVPSSGPADPLSMALANRLVGNSSLAAALETTLTGATLRFTAEAWVAVTGATAACTLNGNPVGQHQTIRVQSEDRLVIGAAEEGTRCYVAIGGDLAADDVLGSTSTYLTAGFGGHKGRALKEGDVLECRVRSAALIATPAEYRLPILDTWAIRAGRSCESGTVAGQLFASKFKVGGRNDRMGVRLEGPKLETGSDGQMPSCPVFPGTVQCPQDGAPYILSVDSGTTGGYPRVAKITRMDLHIVGQLRPGNRLSLIERDDATAARELLEKHAYWRKWLPDIDDVI